MKTANSNARTGQFQCGGIAYEASPEKLGELCDSSGARGEAVALRRRMREEGYLLMRGLLPRDAVFDVRREVTRRLADAGLLRPGTDPMDGFAPSESETTGTAANTAETRDPAALNRHGVWKAPEDIHNAFRLRFMPDVLAEHNAPLLKLLYEGPMIAFFECFLGETVRHFDFTWFRSMFPGAVGTKPHADVVFMGRGEREQLFTAWTPIGDIDFAQGGLAILEGSNNHVGLRHGYCTSDVDAVCGNDSRTREHSLGEKFGRGTLTDSVVEARSLVGGRWLTGEYQAGDVLIFTTHTVHASMDNHSDRVRLSSDSRYQPASRPADERWIGANPVGHGPDARRELIC